MLKCPACERSGGPFRLRRQIQADSQVLRSWACPCGGIFHAAGGSERASNSVSLYEGFQVEHNGHAYPVRLRAMEKHETVWALGAWLISVSGPPDGPGTRLVELLDANRTPLGEWRLQPGWGPSEIGRRLKVWTLPPGLSPDLLARVLVRMLG